MCKKVSYLMFFLLLVIQVNMTLAAEIWWSGSGADEKWSTKANWWGDRVPTNRDIAFIDLGEDTTLIDSSVTAVCDGLHVGEYNWNCYLDITGGSLTVDYDMYISTLHHVDGYGQGIVTMSGGTVSVGGNLYCCHNGWWGLLEMSGGTLDVTGTLWVPGGSAGSEASACGELHLYGGTLTAGNLDSNDLGGDRTIDITRGTLILDGNEVSKLQGYVADGWLQAYGGLSTVVIDYNSVTDKTSVTAVILPEWDDGDANNSNWNSPNNWSPDAVPTANDTPLITMPSHHCYVKSGVTAECDSLVVGEFDADTNSCCIDVNGGTLDISDSFFLGYYLETGNGGGVGRLNMVSGDVNVDCNMHVGYDGRGLMYMTGGNVTVGGEIRVPTGKDGGAWNDDAEGRLYLYGGTIRAHYFVLNWRATNVVEMDIRDPGTLIVDGSIIASDFISWIEMLQLKSYDGNSAVIIDYNETNPGKTTVRSAGNDWWTDADGGNSNWDDADNWNDGVPDSNEYAVINIDTTCLIKDTQAAAECNNLLLSDIGSDAVLDVNSGTLTVVKDMTLGRTYDSNGTVDMDGGTVSVADLTVGYHGHALFDISAGTLDIGDTLEIGNYGFMELTGTGTVKLTGDQRLEVIELVDDFKLGSTGGRIRFDYNETSAGETTITGKITTDHNWNNDAPGDSNWSNSDNWVEDDVPSEVDTAYINIADSNCVIGAGTNAVCDGLQVGKDTATCYLDITGGTLKVSPYTVARNMVIGNRPGGAGVVGISGGTVTVEAGMLVGYNGTGTLNVSGGTLNIGGKLFVSAGIGTGTVNLSGGTINVGEDIPNAGLEVKADGSGTINITAGTLVINGDATARIKEYMANGYLIAYSGRGRIVYDYNVTNSGKTTVTATADNNIAYNPEPAAGADSVSSSVTLKWAPGNSAATTGGHRVYLGGSFDDVNDATTGSSEYKGTRDSNSYTPSDLEAGGKYYWRIDEVNDTTVWKGNVWCFRVSDPTYIREKINFNQDWKFYKGLIASDAANSISYDDYTWRDVAVPHNPKQTNLWSNDPMCYEGYSWYRKHFTLPSAYNGKKVFLEFEGANVTADIWVNGTYMTTHYGGFLPFTVDITSVANYGGTENVIAVKLDNYNDSDTPGAAGWSLFGGIYRDVWIHITGELHVTDAVDANVVAGGGIFATFSNVSSSAATIDVNTHVENEYASSKNTSVITYLYDPNGDLVDIKSSGSHSIAASGKYTFAQSFTVSDPCLWTPETPYLYTIKTQVHNDDSNTVADRVDTAIGIKTVSFADVNGFKLNNVSRKFRGANRTQDWPFIGMAMSNFGQRTEAIKMKKAGHEYVRTAHYAQDPAFLNACDEYGIMVMDSIPTSAHYWGGETFESRSYQQMRDMIRRDRNHAGIITWELSLNETWSTTEYDTNAVNIGHTEYPGSYISGWKSDDLYDVYITTPHNAPGRDYSGSAALIISEYGHFGFGGATSTSDVYRSSGEAAMLQQVFNHKEDHNLNRGVSDLCGDGVWVWRDYGNGWPSGSADRAGLPKFSYYFYQSQRDPNVASVSDINLGPMVYIANYWKADSPNDVTVFSNCDQVKLYINDSLQDTRYPDTGGSNTNLLQPTFTFTGLTYSAGELKAEGLIGGLVKATHVVNTPGAASKLSVAFDTEGQTVYANGEDMFFVHVSVLDANNILVPTASDFITFTVAGPAVTASPVTVNAAAGIASVLVRTLTEPGTITVTATASGLTSGNSSITTVAYDAKEGLQEVTVAPVITSTPVTTATAGVLYTYDVNAMGVPAPTYSLTTWPSGMTIDSTTGVISWTPDTNQVGSNPVTVKATNSAGTDTQNFSIEVAGPPVVLLQDGFETNFDKWTDGGTTDWDRATDQKYSGSYSAHAGSADSSLISDDMNSTGKSSIKIEFWYMDDDIDDSDNVYLQLYNGSTYADRFELGNTEPEDTWHKCDITVNNSGADTQYFRNNFRIKFEGSSIDSGENLWIDDVNVTAQ